MSQTTSMRICEHPEFDLEDFSLRWQKARLSALRSLLVGVDLSALSSGKFEGLNFSEQEIGLLKLVPEDLRELTLRKVFDYSRQLGLGLSKFLGVSLELSDFSDILAGTNVPCYQGRWRTRNQAQVLERIGCKSVRELGSFGCDYWREALDGLVMGAGDTERLARHRSLGHGDQECVDVLFSEEYSVPRLVHTDGEIKRAPIKKYGPIPGEILQEIEPLSKRFEAMKVHLYVDGLSEGALYYRLEADEGVLCGAGGKLLHDSFCKDLMKRFPHITPKDAAPLAVYGGST